MRRGLLSMAICGVAFVPWIACPAMADTLIEPLSAPTPIHQWAGTAVLSVRDVSGKYDLAIQQGTQPARALPGIAPAIEPFDANIGPGPSGSPVLVFARCHAAHRCALMRTTPAGNIEAPISASAGLGGYAPSVWRNRLAFARRSAHGADEVFVVPLEA